MKSRPISSRLRGSRTRIEVRPRGFAVLLPASGSYRAMREFAVKSCCMTARVRTVAFQGVHVFGVDVQVELAGRLPAFAIVGLPDKPVAESKERVRGALTAIGLAPPGKRIIVNLAPADLAKEGMHFDLPIALAMLIALGALSPTMSRNMSAWASWAHGSIAGVAGVLAGRDVRRAPGLGPSARRSRAARRHGPASSTCWPTDDSIASRHQLLQGPPGDEARRRRNWPRRTAPSDSLRTSRAEETASAKRAPEIAAAGASRTTSSSHRLCLVPASRCWRRAGPASWLLLLDPKRGGAGDEHDPFRWRASAGGRQAVAPPSFRRRPSASLLSWSAAAPRAKPGEVPPAHLGVLFLDELPEFHGMVGSKRHLESGCDPGEHAGIIRRHDQRCSPALIAKRSEMAGEAEALQMRVRQILIELDALDTVIRTFQPDIDLEEVRPKQLPPRHAGYRGEVSRAVMTILRTEKRPMAARDIALRMMAERSTQHGGQAFGQYDQKADCGLSAA